MRGDGDALIRAFEALGQNGHLAELVARTRRVASDMVSARRATFAPGATDGTSEGGRDAGGDTVRDYENKLDADAAKTPFGDAAAVIERGPENDGERALASALFAHTVAEASWGEVDADNLLAADILWLATHTPFDATPLIDRALGDEADTVWSAVADRVRRIDAHRLPELGRGEALVGCVALAASASPAAERLASSLAQELHDPALVQVLSARAAAVTLRTSIAPTGATPEPAPRLRGELVPAPRGWIATTALALSGLLFVFHGVRLLARLALAYRCPAEVVLSPESIRVDSRVEMLGRTLREKSTVIGRDALVRAVREVRYPRLGFYAGLLSLAVGTYVGVSTAIDGVRAASPSLFLVGLVLIAVGIGLDLVFSSIVPGARGRCRVVFVPRRGPAVCVGSVDIDSADGALGAIARS